MKILVSCVPFDGGKSGISVYIRHLTAALAAKKQDLTLIVEADAARFFPEYPKIVLPRFCRRALFSMLYHLFILPFRIPFRRYDMAILCAANRRAFCRYPIFTAAGSTLKLPRLSFSRSVENPSTRLSSVPSLLQSCNLF